MGGCLGHLGSGRCHHTHAHACAHMHTHANACIEIANGRHLEASMFIMFIMFNMHVHACVHVCVHV